MRELTKEEVKEIRDLAKETLYHGPIVVICDSHEALRAKVENLEGQLAHWKKKFQDKIFAND